MFTVDPREEKTAHHALYHSSVINDVLQKVDLSGRRETQQTSVNDCVFNQALPDNISIIEFPFEQQSDEATVVQKIQTGSQVIYDEKDAAATLMPIASPTKLEN